MHTVIIANEKMTQLFRDYKNVFTPFLNDEEISFCAWNEDGPDLETALPDLAEHVDTDHNWRAVIVNDPGCFQDKDGREVFDEYNPYDYAVNYGGFQVEDSPIPLIRLTHLLAGYPDLGVCEVTEKPVEERKNRDVVEYETKDYSEEVKQRHRKLQDQYDELLWKPKDIWLISLRRKRTKLNKKDLKEIWTSKLETESSRFWQRNNYPEVCRFMCYDVSDIHNEFYCRELFGFWMTVLTLSLNKIPPSNLQAYRLYRVSCDLDRLQLQNELNHQYSRLCQARETIESALRVLPECSFPPDEEILQVQPVPVVFENNDEAGSYIETRGLGLSGDCPQDEAEMWQREFKDSKKYLMQYVKEPRRAIDRAAEYTRFSEENFYDAEYELDEIQMEEIQETIYQLEEDILSTETMKLVDLDSYAEEMRDVNEQVEKTVQGRMSRRVTLLAGGVAVILYLCGFLPYLFHAGQDGLTVFLKSLILVIVCIACFAGAGFLLLFVFRKRVKDAMQRFNLLTSKIIAGVNRAAGTFEEYLTLICTYMKAQSIVQGTMDREKASRSYRSLIRMHKYAVEETLEQISMWCAAFDLRIKCQPLLPSEEYYDFELMPAECPIYYLKRNMDERNISINTSGDLLTSPYDFVTRLNIERLEIYERGGNEA